MTTNQNIRDRVSKAYARAVDRPAPCCGTNSPETKGVAARLAGYTAADLQALPDDAVINSFGCGNPLAFSNVQPGDTVVDLGSGAGIDLLIAAGRVGAEGRVIGVDMTDEMLAKARVVIAASNYGNIEVRKGLIEDLPVDPGTVDWVISNCVINLSPEKDRVFAEIARVLKPGGRMLVSDIVVEDLPPAVRNSIDAYAACLAGAISEAEYVLGLEKAGLVDIDISERLVYDASQLVSLVESEIADVLEPPNGYANMSSIAELAECCAGKVWSARIRAQKSR